VARSTGSTRSPNRGLEDLPGAVRQHETLVTSNAAGTALLNLTGNAFAANHPLRLANPEVAGRAR
jgi:hypothetical protein